MSAQLGVLVLGDRGFLGSHAAAALFAAGHRVVAGPSRTDLELGSAATAEVVELLRSSDCEVVVNATGQVAGTASEQIRGNVVVTGQLLAAARLAGIRHLVQLGSLAEYGPGHGDPLAEDVIAAPTTSYGYAKLAATELVVAAGQAGDLETVVLRVANPVGAGQPASSVAGRAYRQIAGQPDAVLRLGPLDALRDVVSAADVGRAVVAAVGATPPPGRIVNVGTGRPARMADLVAAIRKAAGHRGPLELSGVGSAKSAATSQPLVADVRLASQAWGWEPHDGLEDAVGALVGA